MEETERPEDEERVTRRQAPNDKLAFGIAVACGATCGFSLPFIAGWSAGALWFIFCCVLPILACSAAQLKVVPVGMVANASMSLALQSLLLYDDLRWPLDWYHVLDSAAQAILFMLIVGSVLSLLVSLPMRKQLRKQRDRYDW